MSDAQDLLRRTPLYPLHLELGARMVEFAGWALPARFEPGGIAEHMWTRSAASLFDVSHMGVMELRGAAFDEVASALEKLVPADLSGLAEGRQRYAVLTNEAGGVIDDLMVARLGGEVVLVVNAARRALDLGHLRACLPRGIEVVEREDLALLAVQGPRAVRAVERLAPAVAGLSFMEVALFELDGVRCRVSRSGYTGEDGFEVQVPSHLAEGLCRRILAASDVAPAGLLARDSLRLEAGLCLYGKELDEATSPVEAGLAWTISPRRRAEGGFPGAEIVRRQLAEGPARQRVGLRPEGRQPVRDGAALLDGAAREVGVVTSGGYGPSAGSPIAMGYVTAALAEPGTRLVAVERGRELPVVVQSLPFVPHRYRRATRTSRSGEAR